MGQNCEKITLVSCFWCIAVFEDVNGVQSVVSGFLVAKLKTQLQRSCGGKTSRRVCQ